jgi:ubiquitin C-terminal hydrolase
MINHVQELFNALQVSKKNKGGFSTKKFMSKIKKSNAIFDNDEHHDSHEFLIWLLGEIDDNITADYKEQYENDKINRPIKSTLITDLFGGEMESIT